MPPSSLLYALDAEQHQAVTAPADAVIVLAGAGSGKTTVLTQRIDYRIDSGVGFGDVGGGAYGGGVRRGGAADSSLPGGERVEARQRIGRTWPGGGAGVGPGGARPAADAAAAG